MSSTGQLRRIVRRGKLSSWPRIISLSGSRTITSAAAASQEYPQHELPPAPLRQSRKEDIKNAKPFSAFLTDTFQRQHDYLRISITEKCNLRCLYCMPEEGVPQSPPADLLTTPEIFMLSSLFVSQGVTKIRLTGGEPTVRRDILPLMNQIGSLRSQGLRELCLTTNGISLHRKLDSMVEAGLTGVNLSLDTLDPWQFQIMTRRKGFEAVMNSIERILEMNRLGAGIKLKINCVVMRGINEKEIIPFIELGREQDLEVRFIEYMPFDGNKWSKGKMLPYQEMLDIIRIKYPDLRKVRDDKNDTSKTYEIPGFVGRIGFITSMTHNFCGSCNRLRITSDGNLKVCLFGNDEVSLRDIIRKMNDGSPIDDQAFEVLKGLTSNRPISDIRRIANQEKELLDVIGLAVSKKKEKHAGMGALENMKNRPMILIDKLTSPFFLSTTPRQQYKPLSFTKSRIPLHLLSQCSHPSATTSIRHYSSSSTPKPPPILHPSATPSSKTKPKPKPDSSTPQIQPRLTHLTSSGTAHMVSISSKTPTSRLATAICTLSFSNPVALPLIRSNSMKKGDVLGVARIAGIMAAKKTSELVPLCHPIAITGVEVDVEVIGGEDDGEVGKGIGDGAGKKVESKPWAGTGQGDAYTWHTSSPPKPRSSSEQETNQYGSIHITATVSCTGPTGVEMEALTAASVAAMTVYDMCKAVDKGMVIHGLRVVRKEGGRSGDWVWGESRGKEDGRGGGEG